MCKNQSQSYRQDDTFQRLNTEERSFEDAVCKQPQLHLYLSTKTHFLPLLMKHGAGSSAISAISGSTAPTTAQQDSCNVILKTVINNNIRQKKFDQTLLMHRNKTNKGKKKNPHPAGSCRLLLRSSSRRAVSWALLMDDDPPAQLFAGQQAVPARSIRPGQGWKPFSLRDETSLNSSKRPHRIYGNISKQTSRRQLSVDQM